ncbi:MAG: LemA family protein [Clostridia bacterium]|nr:LemA family protein [Clostridia bacterium]
MPFLIAIIVILLIVVIWYVSTMNSLRTAQVKIREAESGIDVALAKRCDSLTKQLDVCRGYMTHETATFEKVIAMRSGMTMTEKAQLTAEAEQLASTIRVTAEAYPELKSSENFRALQSAVADAEEHLQGARRAYNANVSAYNQKLVTFPTSMVASMIGCRPEVFFEATAIQKQDVKISFE